MNISARFPVVLPSETQSREFDAKLLLAGLLAECGHPVYVGSRIDIHNKIHTLPRGLYLAKDIRGSSRRMFRILGRLGFEIAAWDEEAFVYSDAATYHERRVDTDNLAQIKAFFALGENNRNLIESAPGYRGTAVHVTGNSRIDMLTRRCRGFFEPEVAELNARFGDFILFNSNFGRLNHFLPSETIARTADGGFTLLGNGTPAFWDFRLDVFDAFKQVLPEVAAAFPDRQIILRPHPSEAHDTWLEAAGGAANVHVVHEGSVYPWIMASAAAVHNGCTTGLESYLMDHPVVVYQPVRSAEFDDTLANQVSIPAQSRDELIALLNSVLADENHSKPSPEIVAQVEDQLGPQDGVLASERMVAIIAEQGEGWFAAAPSVVTQAGGYLESVGRGAVKSINAYKHGHKNSRAYNEHRFPGMSEAEADERLARLGQVLGRFSSLSVRQIRDNIFCVSRSLRN